MLHTKLLKKISVTYATVQNSLNFTFPFKLCGNNIGFDGVEVYILLISFAPYECWCQLLLNFGRFVELWLIFMAVLESATGTLSLRIYWFVWGVWGLRVGG